MAPGQLPTTCEPLNLSLGSAIGRHSGRRYIAIGTETLYQLGPRIGRFAAKHERCPIGADRSARLVELDGEPFELVQIPHVRITEQHSAKSQRRENDGHGALGPAASSEGNKSNPTRDRQAGDDNR